MLVYDHCYFDCNDYLSQSSPIQDFVDAVFLEQWTIARDSDKYYQQCHCKPSQCTYSYNDSYTEERKVNSVEILSQWLGLFGGLSARW